MTQQENLNEFMNRRMAELGLGYKALTNAGIGGQTIQNIKNGVPFRMAEVTKSKLANALQCTIGDINAALSQTAQATPFGEEVRKVPVKKEAGPTMKAVEMLADALQEQGLLSEENQQKTEEKVTVPEQTETLSEETVTNPEQKEIKVSNFEWQPEKPPAEQPKPERKKNSLQRFKRSRTGRTGDPDGRNLPAAAEGYVPKRICKVRMLRNNGGCLCGHR